MLKLLYMYQDAQQLIRSKLKSEITVSPLDEESKDHRGEVPRLESRAPLKNNTEETKRDWLKGLTTDSARRRPESNIGDALSTNAGDKCDVGFDLEVFLIYAKNRYPLQKYPHRCIETILKLLTCFQYSTRYDRVMEAAKRHYVQEMDIAKLIRK